MLSKILLWLILLWLIGSVIYTLKFHLNNYKIRKIRNESEKIDELYESLHGRFNFKLVLFQTVKLFLAGLIFYFLLNFEKTSSDEQLWTEEAKQELLELCINSGKSRGVSQNEVDEYCECILVKFMYAVPDPSKYFGDVLPESIAMKITSDCNDIFNDKFQNIK